MPRARHVPAGRKRRKKFLKRAKGFFQGRGKLYRTARETVQRAMAFATRDRRKKNGIPLPLDCPHQRGLPAKWISYSQLIAGLKRSKVALDRKSLAEIAARDGASFKEIVALAKAK